MGLLKRILRYIAGTVHFDFKFLRSDKLSSQSLHAAVDADWGGCRETRKFTSGWVIAINGSPFVWIKRKQSIIANSSAEAEYIALFDCAQHVSWMRKFFWERMNKNPWP